MGKAQTTFFEYVYAPKVDTDYDAAILGLVDRAIALDRGNIHAYHIQGQYLAVSGRPEDAVLAFDAGLAIDPNAAGLLALRSNAEDYLGRFEQAKSDIQQAMLLSPRDPAMGSGSICAPTLNASSQTRSLHQMAFETQAGAAVRVRRTAQGGVAGGMSEIHKLVAILVADVFGYSRLAGADEDRTLARLRDVSVSSSVFLAKPSEKEALR